MQSPPHWGIKISDPQLKSATVCLEGQQRLQYSHSLLRYSACRVHAGWKIRTKDSGWRLAETGSVPNPADPSRPTLPAATSGSSAHLPSCGSSPTGGSSLQCTMLSAQAQDISTYPLGLLSVWRHPVDTESVIPKKPAPHWEAVCFPTCGESSVFGVAKSGLKHCFLSPEVGKLPASRNCSHNTLPNPPPGLVPKCGTELPKTVACAQTAEVPGSVDASAVGEGDAQAGAVGERETSA